jgi:hypothetical protein
MMVSDAISSTCGVVGGHSTVSILLLSRGGEQPRNKQYITIIVK